MREFKNFLNSKVHKLHTLLFLIKNLVYYDTFEVKTFPSLYVSVSREMKPKNNEEKMFLQDNS